MRCLLDKVMWASVNILLGSLNHVPGWVMWASVNILLGSLNHVPGWTSPVWFCANPLCCCPMRLFGMFGLPEEGLGTPTSTILEPQICQFLVSEIVRSYGRRAFFQNCSFTYLDCLNGSRVMRCLLDKVMWASVELTLGSLSHVPGWVMWASVELMLGSLNHVPGWTSLYSIRDCAGSHMCRITHDYNIIAPGDSSACEKKVESCHHDPSQVLGASHHWRLVSASCKGKCCCKTYCYTGQSRGLLSH